MYSAQPDTFELLCKRAEDTIDMRSKHIVEDAITYARWILRDGREMLTNLTRCQQRCTELLEEKRALQRQLDELQGR